MDKITMAHGSGGEATSRLIRDIFAKYLNNPYLDQMEDSTIVPGNPEGSKELAVTTDSFVVTPYFYPGGNIGRLAVCGTVNDILMSGAIPRFITLGVILEEGLPIADLEKIVASVADTAREAGVLVVAGDTKVVENHSGADGGILINTTGIGFLRKDSPRLLSSSIRAGDKVIVSGCMGDHHAAILGRRMQINNDIVSDNAPLCGMVNALMNSGIRVHELRDVTRGGLATVLHEFAMASSRVITLEEDAIPVSAAVQSFAGILGLDPLYMGNEGKLVAIVAGEDAELALELIRNSPYGEAAAIIGEVSDPLEREASAPPDAAHEDEQGVSRGALILRTRIGGERVLGPLYGEGLPRIC
jgi:hydrogenase expression/formation protein HypE